MGLEEDIKQTKGFESERQKAAINIMYTNCWLNDIFTTILKPYDLTNQQFNVLRILRGSRPKALSTSCIRSRMLDKMSDASRIVNRLCKKDLVERHTCVFDRRLVDVFISKKGMNLLGKIDKSIEGFGESMSSITDSDAAELNRILDKLRG